MQRNWTLNSGYIAEMMYWKEETIMHSQTIIKESKISGHIYQLQQDKHSKDEENLWMLTQPDQSIEDPRDNQNPNKGVVESLTQKAKPQQESVTNVESQVTLPETVERMLQTFKKLKRINRIFKKANTED